MDPYLIQLIDRSIHEGYMVQLREELHHYAEIARLCRPWVKTLLYTRNWIQGYPRILSYHLLWIADLHPVYRLCYDRLVYLVKMSFLFQAISIKPMSTTYCHTDIPMLLQYDTGTGFK
jgi:hypothetical protein